MIGLGAQFSQLIKSQWYSENDLLSHCSVTAFEKNAYKESFEVTQRHGVTSNKSKSFFFFYLGFLSRTFMIHSTAGEEQRISL